MDRGKTTTIRQTIAAVWLVIGLLASIVAFRRFVLPFISAQSPDNPAVPNLTPPYMRLTKSDIITANHQVAVDVKINTADAKTVEADIVVKYNPEILTINEGGVKFYNNYAISQINQLGEGVIDLSFFSNPKRGEPTVSTASNEETRITTLVFNIIKNQVSATQLQLKFNQGESNGSSLTPFFEVRPETPQNILQTTEGILLSLENS